MLKQLTEEGKLYSQNASAKIKTLIETYERVYELVIGEADTDEY